MSDWPITVAARSSRARGRRTLGRILAAAEEELAAYGYHGARMVRIARAAGIAHGTLYVYFRDKADLLAAMQEDVDAELRPALLAMPALRALDGQRGRIPEWCRTVCGVFQRRGAVLQALAEALAEDERSPAGRAALRSMAVTTRHLAGRLRDACGESAEFDPEMAALCLFALLEGANGAVYRGELQVPVGTLADEIARFVHTVAAPPAAG